MAETMVITKTDTMIVLDEMNLSTIKKALRYYLIFLLLLGGLLFLWGASTDMILSCIIGGSIAHILSNGHRSIRNRTIYKEVFQPTETGMNVTRKTPFSTRSFEFSHDDLKNLHWRRSKASIFGPDPLNGFISFDEEGKGEKFHYTVCEKEGLEIVDAIKNLRGAH